jgi:hypothetical protein
MREEMHSDELREDEVARFLRDGLSYQVAGEDERLAGMERSVMQALERRRTRRARRFSIPRVGPAWVYAAAALLLFALGYTIGSRTADPFNQPQGVEFVIYHPEAQQVSLAISYPVEGYPEWQDIPMNKRDGLWYLNLKLPPGTYEYGFKIDGRWWAYDPAADYLVTSADDTINAVREIRIAKGDQT